MLECVVAKSRDPFLTALHEIRERAQTGTYAPGEQIVIIEEARRLGLSTTPVREALSWLCGEGLVERSPTGGFLALRLDAGAVRDFYGVRLICLLAGLELTAGLPAFGRRPAATDDPRPELSRLFDTLVRRAGNGVLLAAYARAAGPLRQVEAVEAAVFPDAAAEAGGLLEVAATEANGPLREALTRYHARRHAAAGLLSLAVGRRAGRGPGAGEGMPPEGEQP